MAEAFALTGNKQENVVVETLNNRVQARAKRYGFILDAKGLFTWPEVKFVTSDETEILKTLNLKK